MDPADRFRRLWELSSGSELLLLQQHHHSVLVSAGRRIHLMLEELGLVTRVSGIWVGLGPGLKMVVVLSSETVVRLGLGLPADEARVGLDVVVVVVVPGSGPVV